MQITKTENQKRRQKKLQVWDITILTFEFVSNFEFRVSELPLEPPPGDRQGLPRDIAAFLGSQEKDGMSHVLRPADATDRDLLLVFGQDLRLDHAQHGRL